MSKNLETWYHRVMIHFLCFHILVEIDVVLFFVTIFCFRISQEGGNQDGADRVSDSRVGKDALDESLSYFLGAYK